MKNRFFISAVVVVLLAAAAVFFIQTGNSAKNKTRSPEIKSEKQKPFGKLSINDQHGNKIIDILIEISDDDYSRANGLMFREDLPETQGMLFIFDQQMIQYFWMKNTPISLDMIFINDQREIVSIEKYTKPYSTRSYGSKKPALFVLEVVAGFCDRHDINPGCTITWKRL